MIVALWSVAHSFPAVTVIHYTHMQCEPDCHKGERVRQVVCREMPGKVLQPDNECPAPKPPTTELCVNRGPCYLTPQWAHGDWSEVQSFLGLLLFTDYQ